MNEQDRERFVKMETTMEFIKDKLVDHIEWESEKYEDMDHRFAKKGYEPRVETVEEKLDKMPDRLSKRFAGMWVETYTKATAFTVVGSILVAITIKLIT